MSDTTATAAIPLPDPAGIVLPPYSGENPGCAMCSNPDAYTKYRPAVPRLLVEEYNGRTERRGPLPERLERCCVRCDYQWDEALNPTPGARTATVEDVATALQHSHQGWALDMSPGCAEHMADALMGMFHLHVRPDHPVWKQQPVARPLLAVPADVAEAARQQLDPALTASVPIPLQPPVERPAPPAAPVPVPLHERPQPPAGPTAHVHGCEQ